MNAVLRLPSGAPVSTTCNVTGSPAAAAMPCRTSVYRLHGQLLSCNSPMHAHLLRAARIQGCWAASDVPWRLLVSTKARAPALSMLPRCTGPTSAPLTGVCHPAAVAAAAAAAVVLPSVMSRCQEQASCLVLGQGCHAPQWYAPLSICLLEPAAGNDDRCSRSD